MNAKYNKILLYLCGKINYIISNFSALNIEESLLLNILFNRKINIQDFDKIDFDRFVKIVSSHFMIPCTYSLIKKNKIENRFPDELINYFSYIYNINLNRNGILLDEINLISKKFNLEQINHVFYKGASMLVTVYKDNIGDRMLKDIDILVAKPDFKKIHGILNSLGYKKIVKYKKWKVRDNINYFNSKKKLMIEIHDRILDKENENLLSKKTLESKIKTEKGVFVPSKKQNSDIIVVNSQMNDFNKIKCSYNFRSIYDYCLTNNFKINLHAGSCHETFHINMLFLKIINESNFNINGNYLYKLRFNLKRKNYFFYIFDKSIVDFYLRLKKIPFQIVEFLFNKDYRKKLKLLS